MLNLLADNGSVVSKQTSLSIHLSSQSINQSINQSNPATTANQPKLNVSNHTTAMIWIKWLQMHWFVCMQSFDLFTGLYVFSSLNLNTNTQHKNRCCSTQSIIWWWRWRERRKEKKVGKILIDLNEWLENEENYFDLLLFD